METVKYGEWEIAVDLEKTREFYSQYETIPNQVNRNFAEYCKSMPEDEKAFFDSFGIDPAHCDMEGFYFADKKRLVCGGAYFICGEYVSKPEQPMLTEEELMENGMPKPLRDTRVAIGNLSFVFQDPDDLASAIPPEMPKGFICVNCFSDETPWLLQEEMTDIMVFKPAPKPWQIHKKALTMVKAKLQEAAYRKEVIAMYDTKFSELGVEYRLMTVREYKKYREQWIKHFAPKDADMADVKEKCLKNKQYSVYLWHLFSFGYAHAEEGEAANTALDNARLCRLALIDDWNGIGYFLRHTKKLAAAELEDFTDITLTPANFEWTYSKTHADIGPYFYDTKKQND